MLSKDSERKGRRCSRLDLGVVSGDILGMQRKRGDDVVQILGFALELYSHR